ncbi:MAG: AMP-binding protein [Thermodesulfobacteriota bacterium]|jgi:long-chain acyl-CoA synthetase
MKQAFEEKGEKEETWPQILHHNYEKYGDSRIAMRYKHNGIWQPYSWKDYYFNVKRLALGLLSLGFGTGDKVLIIGDNAPQWYYAELAAQANHGVSVGLYSDLTPLEIKYIAQNSEARFAIVEDQEQVDKLLQIKGELVQLKRVIYWDYKGLVRYNHPILMGYGQVLKRGDQYEQENHGAFEQNVKNGSANDVCAVVYTSGTTGVPKGAVHTYKTMKASSDWFLHLDPWYENDNVVPSLPPAWVTEQWIAIGCHLLSAAILNFFEKPETQQQDTREIGPNVVFYGARLWENQASEVQARILEADVIKRLAFRLLMPIGYKMAGLKYSKQRPSLLWRTLYALANIVLYRSLRDSLGLSNARICCNTGAMLSPEAFRFYHALNLPLKSLYGTTEGGALSGAKNDNIRLETVGPVQNGAEVKITDKGELIYRQPGIFIGYYKDPDKTAEVLKDGWFYSGDSGFVREDGHIVFIDRLKDIVDLSNGDKLAPQFIESRLRFCPYIKDAWVLAGTKRAYASAIIVIDYGSVGQWAGQKGIAYRTFAELSQKPEVYQLVESYIDRINQDLPAGIRVKKYVNLHKEFDPEEGELTRTRKLRRAFLENRYHELILAIYNNKTEVPIEVEVKKQNGKARTMKTTIKINSVEGDD